MGRQSAASVAASPRLPACARARVRLTASQPETASPPASSKQRWSSRDCSRRSAFFQPHALGGEAEEAFALVVVGGGAADQVHLQQLAQRDVQRLLGHAEQGQQFLHAEARIAGDEEQHAVVHTSQAAAGEHLVRLGGEGLVREEEGFHHGLLLDGVVFRSGILTLPGAAS